MDNKKRIKQVLREATSQGIEKIDKNDFMALQERADSFLNKIDIISNFYEDAISKEKLREKINVIYSQMRQESSFTQEVLAAQLEFEKALDGFIGRTIYLTYVKDDGTFSFFDDANIGKLYQTATAQYGRGNISKKNVFDANDLQEDLKEAIKDSTEKRKNVYTTAIQRYRSNKKESKMSYSPSKHTFYWWKEYHKSLGGWTDPIVNEGPIAEGYAGFVINEESNINRKIEGKDIELALENLWKNYIGKDSIGAALKGDIVYNKNGDIQFAVKKGKFSTARVGQYIRLAYNIKQLHRLTAEELANPTIFDQMTRVTKKTDMILKAINENATEEIAKQISEFGEVIKKEGS